jgi:hypothetical protein
MNQKNESDLLFERYLTTQNLQFEYEPELEATTNRIDYLVQHPEGQLYLEVKQIQRPLPPRGFSVMQPYSPIRSHIHDGAKQFRHLPNTINALVFAAGPNSFVNLTSSTAMLGAMYGDFVFRVPFNPSSGHHEQSEVTTGFQLGNGKMLQKAGIRNSRISAIISLHDYHTYAKEALRYLNTENGKSREEKWTEIQSGEAPIQTETTPCVTVWDNAYARRRFPMDIFRGPMDARWSVEGNEQVLSFVSERRKLFLPSEH